MKAILLFENTEYTNFYSFGRKKKNISESKYQNNFRIENFNS